MLIQLKYDCTENCVEQTNSICALNHSYVVGDNHYGS